MIRYVPAVISLITCFSALGLCVKFTLSRNGGLFWFFPLLLSTFLSISSGVCLFVIVLASSDATTVRFAFILSLVQAFTSMVWMAVIATFKLKIAEKKDERSKYDLLGSMGRGWK
ncbi:MAG: hypothetical protein MJ052_05755 [Sphaerochaetaceae bacterium]|nr:hypothetical protein [Sphaerochaetaceae bacterium]